MKIADNYLILLRDAAINPNQENICYEELLKNTFIFERHDFVNAVEICKSLIELRLLKDDIALKHYEEQLESFENGFIPEYDYFTWKDKFAANLMRGKQRKTKEQIECEIRVYQYTDNLEEALAIKSLIAYTCNAIVFKAKAKNKFKDFANEWMRPESLNYLLEMVEYNAP